MVKSIVVTVMAGLALVVVGGCGTQQTVLRTSGTTFFSASDRLVVPGEATTLQAQFRAGDFLQPQAGHTVRFYREGRLYGAALTDGAGLATVGYTAEGPGDCFFQADVSPLGLAEQPPGATEFLVASRAADEPMMVVDLDKTIVASGFHAVLVGEAEAMPESAGVLHDLAESYTIVYLTHRPDLFGPKSRAWLAEHGFPTGPLLLSTLRTFLQGSGAYKSMMLEDIRRRFTRVEIGIGDKISDVLAYHGNGMRAFLIMPIPGGLDADERAELAAQLRGLPEEIQVVQHWDQIRAVFEQGQRYPAAETIELLQQ